MTPAAIPAAEWRGVAVRFPDADRDAVGPVDLRVAPGERVLLLGPSGSGKSSLLMALTGLIPEAVPAEVQGARLIAGQDAGSRRAADWSDRVAFLFQNPEANLCGFTAFAEVAFSLEQRGLPDAEIRSRTAAALAAMGFSEADGARRAVALSGGEKQRLALAALIAQGADLMLVDEPTAHLDGAATARLAAVLDGLGPDRAAVIVDHRLDGLIERVDRVAVLDGTGRLVAEGPPRRVFRDHAARLDALGVWTPVAAGLHAALAAGGIVLDTPPLTVDEVLAALPRHGERAAAALAAWLAAQAPRPAPPGAEVVRLDRAACRAPDGRTVLRDVSLSLRAGEVLALVGRNGAGKTTLALALAGLARLAAGRREGAAGGLAFQNPDLQFVAGSALDELRASLPGGEEAPARRALAAWGLSDVATQHPLSLSEGQKRRLALAAVALVPGWRLVALDEPTAGLDAQGAEVLAGFVQGLAAEGRAVVIVSHETDFVARVADRVAVVDDGAIAFCGAPAALFDDPGLMARAGLAAPAAHRVVRALSLEAAPC